MQLTEDLAMEYSEEDIKIEEVSIADDGEFSDSTSVTSGEEQPHNMIFTQIYIPKGGTMQEYLASSAPSEMNFKNRPGRKQKLEHLTFEEKLLRKKLKNREAAQTSRDRKKARMTELEMQVRYLQHQNERLQCEKESVCKENERLKQELTKPADPNPPTTVHNINLPHPARCSQDATPPHKVVKERVTSRVERESAEFLELSPQQTAGSMQSVTRDVAALPACVASLKQEVVTLVSTVATLLLVVLMSAGQKPKTGTGSLTLKRAQLQSAFSNLNSSQQVYLSQLLLIIAKELKQAPETWEPGASGWNPVNFLHANVPLFLRYIPSLPSVPSARPASLPSLATLLEATMKKKPIPS